MSKGLSFMIMTFCALAAGLLNREHAFVGIVTWGLGFTTAWAACEASLKGK